MLNASHPEDERLAALASHDPEADGDSDLGAHVADCARCADLVSELGALRASLAELPDLAPPRPLQLLPVVAPAPPTAADRLAVWVRRVFAPVVTAGAALALVGAVGTAAPALSGMAGSQSDGSGEVVTMQEADDAGAAREGAAGDASAEMPVASGPSEPAAADEDVRYGTRAESPNDDALTTLPAERSPWPMVLFTGVAVVIGAFALRWILSPRPG